MVREPGPHFLVHGDAGTFLKYGMDSQEESLKAGMRPGNPEYGIFEKIDRIEAYLKGLPSGFVVKPDGLTGGKGVKVSGEHLPSRQVISQ